MTDRYIGLNIKKGVTLQDCIDELEKIKKIAVWEECGVDPKRITKVQYMIQSVSEAVLNRGCST